jgi:DNA-binding transcriptional regulator YhcF (GntR family)
MPRLISAGRVATLVGGFDRSPAYAGLADALILLIGDGRIALDVRLPSERELTDALGVSRTTVTRAYAELRDAGYAAARRGAGTFTRVPGGRARAHDRALLPARATATRSTSTAPRRPRRPGSRRPTPTRRPTCRRTSAGTATSPRAFPSCSRRSRGSTTGAGCRPTPTRSW